jgi:hypothetical protein
MAEKSESPFAMAYQAIGEYFCAFSRLEGELGETIMVILRLQDHEARDTIIVALGAIDISKKIGLVKDAVQLAKNSFGSETSENWKKRAGETMEAIWKCIPDRNLLAHSYLEPKSDGSVDIASHGKFKGIPWNKDKFAATIGRLVELAAQLEKIKNDLQKYKVNFPIPSDWMMTSYPHMHAIRTVLYPDAQNTTPLPLKSQK